MASAALVKLLAFVKAPAFGEFAALVAIRARTPLVYGNIQLVSLYPDCFERLKYLARHILG